MQAYKTLKTHSNSSSITVANHTCCYSKNKEYCSVVHPIFHLTKSYSLSFSSLLLSLVCIGVFFFFFFKWDELENKEWDVGCVIKMVM